MFVSFHFNLLFLNADYFKFGSAVLLDPIWDVSVTRSKGFRKTLDFLESNIPPDDRSKANINSSCLSRIAPGNDQTLLNAVKAIGGVPPYLLVKTFLQNYPTLIPDPISDEDEDDDQDEDEEDYDLDPGSDF